MTDPNLRIKEVFIENEMKDAYLSYAMSVIVFLLLLFRMNLISF
jgi:DNA gyrase/topoisomerase IV subunit A